MPAIQKPKFPKSMTYSRIRELLEVSTTDEINALIEAISALTAEDIDQIAELNAILTDANLVQDTDSRLTDSREWTADLVSQEDAEAGTSTDPKKWSAKRVSQAIAALASSGGVSGPGSATDNAIVRFDGSSGDTLQNSSITVDDTGVATFPTAGNITIGSATTRARFQRGSMGAVVAYGYDIITSTGPHGLVLDTNKDFTFASDPNTASTFDVGYGWKEAGVAKISDGSTGYGCLALESLELESFTIATLPDEADYEGRICQVSDPASGKAPFVYSDGTDWRYVMDNTTV